MPNVEVLVIVTVTDDNGPTTKSLQGKGLSDALAALKNADQAIDLIIAEDGAWTENFKYRYREQLKAYEDRKTQIVMDEVVEGRQGQGA